MVLYLLHFRNLRRNDEVRHHACSLAHFAILLLCLHSNCACGPKPDIGRRNILMTYLPPFSSPRSCIFLPGTVGVGSSGAVMGMLSSWVVWIIFRW